MSRFNDAQRLLLEEELSGIVHTIPSGGKVYRDLHLPEGIDPTRTIRNFIRNLIKRILLVSRMNRGVEVKPLKGTTSVEQGVQNKVVLVFNR